MAGFVGTDEAAQTAVVDIAKLMNKAVIAVAADAGWMSVIYSSIGGAWGVW
jgi:hypothetical protein